MHLNHRFINNTILKGYLLHKLNVLMELYWQREVLVPSENLSKIDFPTDNNISNFNISLNHDCTCCLLAAIMFSLSTSGFRALYCIPKSCSVPAFLSFKIPSSTYIKHNTK